MNKTDLIQAVAEKTGLTKLQAGQAVSAMLEALTEALLREERVQLMGFGTFETKYRPARQGHNPRTLEPVEVPASRTVTFRAGNGLRRITEE